MHARRFLLAGLGAASLGALSSGMAAPSAATKPQRRQRIPNVELTTHTGTKVKFYDDLIHGKVFTINFMYALCNASCPPMTQNLAQVQALLGKRVGIDVFMYSISLRPEQDTPEELAHYAKMYRVKPGWLFLTGIRENIEAVRYALGFYDPDPAIDKEAARHIGMVRIGNDKFDRWGMAPALATPEMIVSTIRHVDRKAAAVVS